MSARLAYAPSIGLSPQGTISSFDKNAATKTYSLPVTASWQVDLFGQLLNSKRNAQVTLKQTKAYRQAVQTQVIANIANMYYTLLMLDRQLEITQATAEVLKRNAETVQALSERSTYTSAALAQSKSCLCTSSGFHPRHRAEHPRNGKCPVYLLGRRLRTRSNVVYWKHRHFLRNFPQGIPLQLLSNRPDVKAAEMSLAKAAIIIRTLPVPLSIRRSLSAVLPDGQTVQVPPLSIRVSYWLPLSVH